MKFQQRHKFNFILLIIAAVVMSLCFLHQRWYYKGWHQGSGKYIQRVHLPDEEVIRIAALGYDNLYADFLTLRAIQMFGAAWDTESGEVEPIHDYFDILTSLDPDFDKVYELSHLVLSDDHGAHEEALDLLRKGIQNNPDSWQLPYLGLYTALWNMEDPDVAREFLHDLRRVPDAPEHILRMEEYIERQSGKFHAAFEVNLKNYLNYVKLDMDTEAKIAFMKFRAILDGWYRLELARAAEKYYNEKGMHPRMLEDLLLEEGLIPRFEAPTMDSVAKAIDYYTMQEGDISEFQDEIREMATVEIVGIPPEPNGTWYFINPSLVDELPQGIAEQEDVALTERFPYIQPAFDMYLLMNKRSTSAQQRILNIHQETGEYPEPEDIARFLSPDGFGGHWVYIKEGTEDGYPRFFSTTVIRKIKETDPRMGFSGTINNLPPRSYKLSDELPPYLTTFPSIWDFEEDAEWALCIGFVPGIRLADQPQELKDEAEGNASLYMDCNSHIGIPDIEEPAEEVETVEAE